jgi:hypothetical protein
MTGVHEREGDDDDQTSVPWRVAHDPPRPTSRPVPASSMWCPDPKEVEETALSSRWLCLRYYYYYRKYNISFFLRSFAQA